MAKWTFLFSQLIHFLMEKKFSIFRKNNFGVFGEALPLWEVSLYMLRPNRDRLPIGGVCLIWRGYCTIAVPCMAGIEYRREMKKDGTIADSIPG